MDGAGPFNFNPYYRALNPIPKRPQICFTGFEPDAKEYLEKVALDCGFEVHRSVTHELSYLCLGDNPGPMKIQKAKTQGVTFLTLDQFKKLIETGELPTV